MDMNQLFPSNFLKAADLAGPITVAIKAVSMQTIGQDSKPKPVLTFLDLTKEMVLNKTNAQAIAKLYGANTDGWAGKQIVLARQNVDFRGQSTIAIRVMGSPEKPLDNVPF